MNEARMFYTSLYTPDPVDSESINTMLSSIPSDICLTQEQCELLSVPPTMDDIYSLILHSPLGKSPGLDGIPFELYKYLMHNSSDFLELFLKVVKDTFLDKFPPTWKKTGMVLLYKKGDPELL